jgi:ubiquinone/menaquinone biosynthesis C-methylase UbiE
LSNLKEEQYKDSSKFNARIYLHYKFGTNKYPWPLWVFDNIRKEENLKVLEIGCGNGLLWILNANRIPKNWDITLSDFSEGMLNDAKNNIGHSINKINYEVFNIENIPYENNTYDVIIANHILYHVTDRKKAISEIHRVLKIDGAFYTATMSNDYMKEMGELIKAYISQKNKSEVDNAKQSNNVISNFSLQNGEEQLKEYFDNVILKIYKNSLIINEAEPFIDYIYSCIGITQESKKLNKIKKESFLEFMNNKIKINGDIIIPSDFGIFINKKNIKRGA